jgi:hypothetical protein
MSNSDLIRKYFSAYENKDRKAVESLPSKDFVFTSPYDYRIDRETYFKRCWPYSEQSPIYEIGKKLIGELISLRNRVAKGAWSAWRHRPVGGFISVAVRSAGTSGAATILPVSPRPSMRRRRDIRS